MVSNTQLKTAGSGLMLVLVVVGLLVGAAGGAAGQTSTTTATTTDTATGVELANSTVAVDNDTRSVYAQITAGPNESITVDVTFSGVDADGNETELETRTVTVNASQEQLVERTDVNTTAYDSYRVTVNAPNVDSTNATAEIGKVAEIAGGGGGFSIGGSNVSMSVLALVAVVAAAVLAGRRDE